MAEDLKIIFINREREDEEAARILAEELEKEEELQRRKRVIQDEKLAQKLQVTKFLIINLSCLTSGSTDCYGFKTHWKFPHDGKRISL